MTLGEIAADVQRNWLLYASMPVVAAVIGYVTKIVAIRMMFEPLEFFGVPPFLGWQGIVPRHAARMAGIACDLMTGRLISPQEIFRRLDPARIAKEIERPMLEVVDDITREVAEEFQPGFWESLPEQVRKLIIKRIQSEAPHLVQEIMRDLTSNIDRVFDLKDMVVTNLVRDKHLLNRLIQRAGDKEFRFIARSGLYFGFVIGCVQAVTWAATHSMWIMPLFGLFTGWFTDWLALKMIFRPMKPERYLGAFEWHGLFHKRRHEVAAEYGELIAQEILTPRNILDAVLRGPLSDRLFGMVQKQVRRIVDEQAGFAKPLVVLAVGTTRYQQMKEAVAKKVMERLPETMRHIEKYAGDAMDIRNTLVTKMQQLTDVEFEGVLRPAFQQDEWKLIAVGAALGFLVGELQVHVMLHLGT
jgi:uncharacterized membrane protein YheB (UPF0754 family)